MTDNNELKDRVVLVTGASRGIGYAASLEAARRGAHVIAVARTVGGLEELDDEIQALGGATTLVPLDLGDFEAIDRLGRAVYERWGRLDGLIGNAGLVGGVSPVPHLDPEEFERTLAINVTANFRLIRSFDTLLRASDAGRAVFLTSGAARIANPYRGLYSATKAALDALIKSYSGEMVETTVCANLFSPGLVRTQMRAQVMPGEDPTTLPKPSEIVPALVDMIAPSYAHNGMIYSVKDKSLKAILS